MKCLTWSEFYVLKIDDIIEVLQLNYHSQWRKYWSEMRTVIKTSVKKRKKQFKKFYNFNNSNPNVRSLTPVEFIYEPRHVEFNRTAENNKIRREIESGISVPVLTSNHKTSSVVPAMNSPYPSKSKLTSLNRTRSRGDSVDITRNVTIRTISKQNHNILIPKNIEDSKDDDYKESNTEIIRKGTTIHTNITNITDNINYIDDSDTINTDHKDDSYHNRSDSNIDINITKPPKTISSNDILVPDKLKPDLPDFGGLKNSRSEVLFKTPSLKMKSNPIHELNMMSSIKESKTLGRHNRSRTEYARPSRELSFTLARNPHIMNSKVPSLRPSTSRFSFGVKGLLYKQNSLLRDGKLNKKILNRTMKKNKETKTSPNGILKIYKYTFLKYIIIYLLYF